MADSIKGFRYKTAGRGRGLLAFSDFEGCRRPLSCEEKVGGLQPPQGETKERAPEEKASLPKLVVALFDYTANPDSPGGFREISLQKGQLLEFVGPHSGNEHWWEVRSEAGEKGFVPASYVLLREDQVLPWLQISALQSEEDERKERVKRLAQQKDSDSGKGFGLAPKNPPAKPYVSAYSQNTGQVKSQGSSHFCEVCEKSFNGPKPYQAHMASRGHREEVEIQKELRNT